MLHPVPSDNGTSGYGAHRRFPLDILPLKSQEQRRLLGCREPSTTVLLFLFAGRFTTIISAP